MENLNLKNNESGEKQPLVARKRNKQADTLYANEQFKNLSAELNKITSPYGIEVNYSNDIRILTSSLSPESKASFRNGSKPVGWMHVPQLEVLKHVLEIYLIEKDSIKTIETIHCAIEGATQSGKTGLLNILTFVFPVITCLYSKETIVPCRLIPDSISLDEDTTKEIESFVKLFSTILNFTCKDEKDDPDGTHTISSYFESLKEEVPGLPESIYKSGFLMRTNHSLKERFNYVKNIVQTNWARLLVLVDESHARSAKGSVLDEFLQLFKEDPKYWCSGLISVIGVSATNAAYITAFSNLGFPCIPMGVGDGYTGFPYLLTTKHKINVAYIPEISSLDDVIDQMNLEGNRLYSKSDLKKLLNNPNSYLKKGEKFTSRLLPKIQISTGAEHFAVALALLVRHCFNSFPTKGIILRILNHNKINESLLKRLKKLIPDIEWIFINQDKNQSITKTVIDIVGPESDRKPYCILVTSKARMGDVIPPDCKVAIDLTNKSETTALLQGLAGRITGYTKDQTIYICSNENAHRLNKFIDTGVVVDKKGKPLSLHPHVDNKFSLDKSEARSEVLWWGDLPGEILSGVEQLLISMEVNVTYLNGKIKLKRIRNEDTYPCNELMQKLWNFIEENKKCQIKRTAPLPNGRHRIAIRSENTFTNERKDVTRNRDSLNQNLRPETVIVVNRNNKIINIVVPIKPRENPYDCVERKVNNKSMLYTDPPTATN